MRVEIAVASKHGSTREIADAIGSVLADGGHDVRVLDAEDVQDFTQAEAVIIGSAVYARWMKPARHLLKRHAADLAKVPLWLFSSGPLGDPLKPAEPIPEELEEAAADLGAHGCVVFAGKLDLAALSARDRLVARALRAEDGDFRNWEDIRKWAQSIDVTLKLISRTATATGR